MTDERYQQLLSALSQGISDAQGCSVNSLSSDEMLKFQGVEVGLRIALSMILAASRNVDPEQAYIHTSIDNYTQESVDEHERQIYLRLGKRVSSPGPIPPTPQTVSNLHLASSECFDGLGQLLPAGPGTRRSVCGRQSVKSVHLTTDPSSVTCTSCLAFLREGGRRESEKSKDSWDYRDDDRGRRLR